MSTPALHTICYVSTANTKLEDNEFNAFFDFIVTRNRKRNITGILLYQDGNFMQIMEGEPKGLHALYDSIKQDQRHHHLIEILNTETKDRIFENYDTGFSIVNNEKSFFKLKLFMNWIENNFDGNIKKRAEIIQSFIKYV